MKLIHNLSMARWLGLSILVVALDQWTKWLAESLLEPYRPLPVVPMLNMTLMYNEGAAFSFLADAGGWQRWLFAAFALVMTAVLVIWLLRLKNEERAMAMGLSLIAGGAVGNLIDRLMTGRVVDFIDVYVADWHWPAFNIADSAITCGICLLLLISFRGELRQKRAARDS
jgi:signal peptidase II